MINLKLITIAILLILLTNCGFEIIDKRELLNFNIKEISTNGDKRINFEFWDFTKFQNRKTENQPKS